MFRNCVIFFVFSSCVFSSFSQETPVVFNVSGNGRMGSRNPVDYESQEPNLWLISRGDPIPASLNGRWSVSDAISRGQIVTFRENDYNSQLTNDNPANSPGEFQPPVALISGAPVLRYDRTLTAASRRQSSDGSEFGVQNPDAVLVQLPVQLTEGLWERPQSLQNAAIRRQNYEEKANIEFDETISVQKPDEIPAAFAPIQEPISRLPSSDIDPQGESNIPSGRYHQLPVQSITPIGEYAKSVNTSGLVNLPESSIRDIWLLRQGGGEQSTAGPQTSSEKQTYENYDVDASQNSRRIQEVESILTSEDIELLERLGILSSLVIEPLVPENASVDTTSRENSEREYESEPVLIDSDGQSYMVDPGRENTTNLSDVVLIDVPHFTVAEYHSNIPENAGIDSGAIRISPYITAQSEHPSGLNAKPNETFREGNSTNLTDRQLLEILQLLNLDFGDFFNLSVPSPTVQETKLEEKPKAEDSDGDTTIDDKFPKFRTPLIEASSNKSVISVEANKFFNSSRQSLKAGNDYGDLKNKTAFVPTVGNGRIQPRLLDGPTPKENEIIERLIHNALPVSESKLEILKRLHIQPQPYFFGFRQDDGNGTLQHRNETSDAKGIVKGSYGYRDAMGVYRNVSYIADDNGFHAVVKSNEPGIVSHNTADAVFMSETPPLAALIKMMAYKRPKLPTNVTEKSQYF